MDMNYNDSDTNDNDVHSSSMVTTKTRSSKYGRHHYVHPSEQTQPQQQQHDDDDNGEEETQHLYQSSQEQENELLDLQNAIQFWKKFLCIGNTFVFLLSLITILLYTTTDLLQPKIADEQTTKQNMIIDQCLNQSLIIEENDIDSFIDCVMGCTDIIMSSLSSSCCYSDSFKEAMSNNIPCNIDTHTKKSSSLSSSKPNEQVCNDICIPTLSTSLDHFKTYLSTICTPQSTTLNENGSLSYSTKCQNICQRVSCCFSLDDELNCLQTQPLICESFFDSCQNIFSNEIGYGNNGIGIGPQITNGDK